MKNILLIEDEENLNRGISLKLKKEGYAVFSAACVSEGLKLFQDNTIDLVICDIGLPDGSGLDLCANIRAYQRMRDVVTDDRGVIYTQLQAFIVIVRYVQVGSPL